MCLKTRFFFKYNVTAEPITWPTNNWPQQKNGSYILLEETFFSEFSRFLLLFQISKVPKLEYCRIFGEIYALLFEIAENRKF